jgi:pimeloyl-ACP methyl ester carboxylesterase
LRPIIVAHSFGGFPTMAASALYGELWRAVVLADTPLFSSEQREKLRREGRGGPRAERTEARIYPTLAEALARFRLIPRQPSEHLFILDHIARASLIEVAATDSSPAGWRWRFDPQLWSHYSSGHPSQYLRQAGCPVALMRGARSQLVTDDVFAYGVGIAPPGSVRIELADADHHLMLDQPLEFVRVLCDHFDRWPG